MDWRSLSPIPLFLLIFAPSPLLAQSITPANDGTETEVLQEGDRYTITGGTRARENLFHSFERLGLSPNEIATFLSQPGIENILGRVVGGDASFIDGLLQVQGNGANLYLMNPAGIVFGPNAQLDLSGSFYATSATGIGFGDRWFNALGDNTYADLVGTPDSFAFTLATGGAIANLANLAVNPGETLGLIGGTVVNTGTLTAPGGTITLASVPGGNRIRLSQPGSLLSLELEAPNGIWDTALNPAPLTPLSLPQLLTGGNLTNASQITLNPDGTIQLRGANVSPQDGTTLVAGTLSAAGTADAEINVVGDRVALLNANLDASGTTGGGTVRIGGDYQGADNVFSASRTYVSADSRITADAGTNGNGGRAIVWADDTTQFWGTISAQGGTTAGDGGFVEVSGAQNLLFDGLVNVGASQGQLGTLLLDPTNITISNLVDDAGVGAALPDILAAELPGDININATTLQSQVGNVVLEATDNITIADGISLTFVEGGSITFTADTNGDGVGAFSMDQTQSLVARGSATANGRDITISGAQVTVGNIDTGLDAAGSPSNGGRVQISSTNGDIVSGAIITAIDNGIGNSGNITLSAVGGNITNRLANAYAVNGSGGTITFRTTGGNINSGDIISASNTVPVLPDPRGGDINLEVTGTGTITTGLLQSFAFNDGPAGNITVTTANGNIAISAVEAYSRTGVDGSVTLTAGGAASSVTVSGGINVRDSLSVPGNDVPGGGNITLTGNEINLLGGVNSIQGTGQLVLQPTTATQSIVLGSVTDSGATTLDLLASDLTTIQAGFSAVTLGRADSTGTVQLVSIPNLAAPTTLAGASTLLGPDQPTTWRLTGSNAGDLNGVLTFRNVQALQGGSANDTFAIDNGVTFGGAISGGSGLDTYDFSAYTTDLTVNLATLGLPDIESILGGQASNTLIGANTPSFWAVTGVDAGTINGTLSFSRFQNLQGGSADDTVIVTDAGRITGRLLGGEGSDRLSAGSSPTSANNWVITGASSGSVNGNNFEGFEGLTGAVGDDQFQFTTDEAFEGNIEALAGQLLLTGNTVRLTGDISAQGDVEISADGDIQTGSIDTRTRDTAGALLEPGRTITLTSRNGSVTTEDLNASGTQGGTITVNAQTAITTGAINTSGSFGNGGNVTLDPIGDIQVDWINAEGGDNGIGGTVDITAGRFFRATDAFTSRSGEPASISTAGGLGGGAITLRHGGNGNIPFYIGDNFGNNGSRAAITNGTDTFASGEFFFNSITRGRAQILTNSPPGNEEPTLPPCEGNCDESEPTPPPQNTEGVLEIPSVSEARDMLLTLAEQTGIPPALIYISFVSPEVPLPNDFAEREAIASQQITSYLDRGNPTPSPVLTLQPQDTDELELMLVLPEGDIIRRRINGVTRGMVAQTKQQLISQITAPNRFRSTRYLVPAQQLYQWLIAPLEAELTAENIGNLSFILDTGLRSLPLSALYDGDQFLIERYSIGLMPSVSLTDTRYRDLRNVPVLAMGASEFNDMQPLPAVPIELETVTEAVPNSVAYLNRDFTEENLLASRYERPYGIVHLATHAEFLPGELQNSYIQFGDRRLPLNDLRQLRLNDPPVELLVLSACKTALGDDQAELGFGGLAVQTGVRSVLASLWYVSDTGTLSFMTEFYRQLQTAPIRAEALRQTQLALLQGKARIQNDQLITSSGAIPLPPELQGSTSIDLTHPYFWASFTMIGSPW